MPESANALVLRLVAERLDDPTFTAELFKMLREHASTGEMPTSAMTAKSFETACSFSTACSFDTALSGTGSRIVDSLEDVFAMSSTAMSTANCGTNTEATRLPLRQIERANVGLCDTVISNSASLTQLVRGFPTIERFLIEHVSLPPDAISDDFARELAQRGCVYAILRPFRGLRQLKGTRLAMTDDGILALCFDSRDAIPFRRIYVDGPSISKDFVRNLVERSANSPVTHQLVLTMTNVRLDALNTSEYSTNRSDFKLPELDRDYTKLDFEHANGIRLQLCFDHPLYDGRTHTPWVTVQRGRCTSPQIFSYIDNEIMWD